MSFGTIPELIQRANARKHGQRFADDPCCFPVVRLPSAEGTAADFDTAESRFGEGRMFSWFRFSSQKDSQSSGG